LRTELASVTRTLSYDLHEKMIESAKAASDFIINPDLSSDDVSVIQQLLDT